VRFVTSIGADSAWTTYRKDPFTCRQVNPASVACRWVQHLDVYSAGYAAGDNTFYDLAAAQTRCLELTGLCGAVTCVAGGEYCTVRAAAGPFSTSALGESTWEYSCPMGGVPDPPTAAPTEAPTTAPTAAPTAVTDAPTSAPTL
jgi:hypothetical protein